MSITTQTDTAKDLTTFTVTGVLRFDKVMPAVKVFYNGDATKHVLWDLRETTDIQLTSEQVEAIAGFSPRYDGERVSGKTAFVAQEDILFGVSRMFEIQSNLMESPLSVMVFRSANEAYQWFDEP